MMSLTVKSVSSGSIWRITRINVVEIRPKFSSFSLTRSKLIIWAFRDGGAWLFTAFVVVVVVDSSLEPSNVGGGGGGGGIGEGIEAGVGSKMVDFEMRRLVEFSCAFELKSSYFSKQTKKNNSSIWPKMATSAMGFSK